MGWLRLVATPLHAYSTCTPRVLMKRACMRWLRLVGSLKWYVSYVRYSLFYKALLQKRPIILCSLLIVATPYQISDYASLMFKRLQISVPDRLWVRFDPHRIWIVLPISLNFVIIKMHICRKPRTYVLLTRRVYSIPYMCICWLRICALHILKLHTSICRYTHSVAVIYI